ncbi:PfkB family carbohydrate kinase [Leeia sp. TBRC 13508]|uniref:PfkB family carbohydrate kinase n=1 Tax=Leeia speluncae TaxID=2884804 RepID=A0ABS8D2L9_9NEIS|nr:PfkB family carbohydrate kinase [Leeia speluncae]MCB6182231.1 PfkB family carbohydrate kinase [Leeia speluncae]
MSKEKIITLDEISALLAAPEFVGKKIIHCHGTFDLMHAGHIRHLQKAKSLGDVLVVTVTSDRYVRKGPGRPVFSQQLRAEYLSALAAVDYVCISDYETANAAIESVKPSLYVKGSDYVDESKDVTGNISKEIDAVRQFGGDVYFTDEITFSSTKLLNEHFDVFSLETREFLNSFKEKCNLSDFLNNIKRLKSLNVLVIGDAILDEYHYVSVLGQTGKGNTLAVKYGSEEQFLGGSIAVAKHVAGFAGNVTLLAALGNEAGTAEKIQHKLPENITTKFVHYKSAQTLLKRRFVDQEMQRLFEVYYGGEESDRELLDAELNTWITAHAAEFDVVIVPDFGNGMISKSVAETISKESKFLAVNTQINSGNRGYHVITRYPHADFLCLNEPEARLAAHDKQSAIEEIAEELRTRLNGKSIAITRGVKGALLVDKDAAWSVPALSSKVIDRVGAGDAFLSVAALAAFAEFSPEEVILAGSIAAALDVQIVCNRESVDPVLFAKYATTLLK